jgi:hypothetical protein
MGTLGVFCGLITYLFVAAGDVPKVPYQTRLDLFMMFSFFVVAACLFLHGLLYFWRESDLEEDEDEEEHEKEKGNEEEKEKEKDVGQSKDDEPPVWRIREYPRGPFSFSAWFNGLHFTRKWEAFLIPGLMIIYSIGVAVIFGRPVSDLPTQNQFY